MADAVLERIEKKIDGLTDHVTALDRRIGGVEQGVAGLDRRLTQVEGRLGEVEGRLGKVEIGLTQIDERMVAGFKRLEAKVDSHAKIQTDINSDLSDKHQKHEERIAALEQRK